MYVQSNQIAGRMKPEIISLSSEKNGFSLRLICTGNGERPCPHHLPFVLDQNEWVKPLFQVISPKANSMESNSGAG